MNGFTLAFLALLSLASCKSTPKSEAFKLSGSLNGVSEGTAQLIRTNSDRTTEMVDSVSFTDGTFVFEGVLPEPEMLRIVVNPGNWALSVFLENSEQTLTADTTGARHYDYAAYGGSAGAEVREFKLTGSSGHDVIQVFENTPERQAMTALQEDINNRFEATEDPEEKDKIREEAKIVYDKRYASEIRWIDSFARANPTAPVGPYLLENYYKFNQTMPLEELKSRVRIFQAPADSSKYNKILVASIALRSALLPGSQAPDFTALAPDSTEFTLSSLRGQYVLLDFWASWCKPCRAAIPHWKEVHAKYHDKGFEILGITNDSRWPDWFNALDVEKMPWLQVADDFPVKNMPARISTLYDVPVLPTYILLDKEGKIVIYDGSKEEIDQKLKEIFGE